MSSESHDPGGKVRIKLPVGMSGEATFSPCDRYRPLLTRRWAEGRDVALWIGANPSTATEDVDDPTVQREWTYSRLHLGVAAYVKANVMDYRATNPVSLLDLAIEPVSPENFGITVDQALRAKFVILAFGLLKDKSQRKYAGALISALESKGISLYCLGFTADGSPRHPLYIKQNTRLISYPVGSYQG